MTRERLLEWETAAEAELGHKRTAIDRYIDWTPLLAAALGVALWLTRPHALLGAAPILALWACSKPLALWLNASPVEPPPETTRRDEWLLRKSALYIWRYFAELSNEEQNWLVPDNVQDDPPKLATSISPTNVGLLLNARQVANELGYITVPEMLDLTQKTLGTMDRMRKYRGHLLNWYDTRTLEAKRRSLCRQWTAAIWWRLFGRCAKDCWIACGGRCSREGSRRGYKITFAC